MRIVISAVSALSLATPVLAHEFWVRPTRFAMDAPGEVPLTIYVGHGAASERWGMSADRVVLFRSIGPDGAMDRRSALTLDGPRYDAVVPLARRGAYVFGFQSTQAFSELPAARFNQYLADEGLTNVQEHRKRTGTERAAGREQYSRRAKTIVQVGPVDEASIARVTRPVGLSLEIVPDRHPGTIKAGEQLKVQVLYNRRPLPGALVKLTSLDARKPAAPQRTNRAGEAVFVLPGKGSWQFGVVWSEATPGNAVADYRTIFSSLTFGS